MVRLIDILEKFIEWMREDNPFGLVLKGGTALAIHHLPGHRESEDLDFDVPVGLRNKNSEVIAYLKERLERLKVGGIIKEFEIPKAEFASTDRYHMTVLLSTHIKYRTKIDLNYKPIPEDLELEGQLRFYTSERTLVDKLLTFASRAELKDFYDISMLLDRVRAESFKEPEKVAKLVDLVLGKSAYGVVVTKFKKELMTADLKFRNLKCAGIESFVTRTNRNLRKFRNELVKRT